MWYLEINDDKKSSKNGFDSILFTNSILWYHIPKIIHRAEISATPRASKRQYMSINGKYWKKQQNIFNFFHFFWYSRGARCCRNFWVIDDFWPMMSYECSCAIICIYDTHIWKYDLKHEKYRKNVIFQEKILTKIMYKIPKSENISYILFQIQTYVVFSRNL